MGSRRWLFRVLLVLAISAVQSLPSAERADALVEHLHLQVGLSPTSSEGQREVTQPCGGGDDVKVLSAGAQVIDGGREVGLVGVGLDPAAGLDLANAAAQEDDDGYDENWSLSVWAICAEQLSGLQRVQSASSYDSTSPKSEFVQCEQGKKVIGIGGRIHPTSRGAAESSWHGNVFLEGLERFSPPFDSIAVVRAAEDEDGTDEPWILGAEAICADPLVGLEAITNASGTDSSATKTVTANCPPSKRVVGMGAKIAGLSHPAGSGQVQLDRIVPNVSLHFGQLTKVTVGAHEDKNGYSGTWQLQASAFCVDPDELGLEQVSEEEYGAGQFKDEKPECSDGRRPYGAGASIWGDEVDAVGLMRVGVEDVGNTHRVFAIAQNRYPFVLDPGNWGFRAYAICAEPLFGRTVHGAQSPLDSQGDKSVSVSCPAGKKVLGAGGGQWDNATAPLVIDDLFPSGNLETVTVRVIEEEPTSVNWTIVAQAVCARPPPGLQRVSATSATNSAIHKIAAVSCPSGKRLTGLGGRISGGGGRVRITELRPLGSGALTAVRVRADEAHTGYSQSWFVQAYGICATAP